MSATVIHVDGEKSVLAGKKLPDPYELICCSSYPKAIAALKKVKGCCVLLAELNVGGESGVDFLATVSKQFPNVVKMALTASRDYEIARDALNRGGVFRIVEKPCDAQKVYRHITQAMQVCEAENGKRRSSQQMLIGSVRTLVDVLELVNPEAMGFSQRIRDRVMEAGKQLRYRSLWELELAVMLSHIGCVALPGEILDKVSRGKKLSPEEEQIFGMHPTIASGLISNIKSMGRVAEIVEHQHDSVNDRQPLGARIIKAALDIDQFERLGWDSLRINNALLERTDVYDPKVAQCMAEQLCPNNECTIGRELRLDELAEGMVMDDDLVNENGTKLLLKGQPVSRASLNRLKAFQDELGVAGTLKVQVKVPAAS